jgi:hypothetical protein
MDHCGQAWWCTPVISGFRRLRQNDLECKTSLDYIGRSISKEKEGRKEGREEGREGGRESKENKKTEGNCTDKMKGRQCEKRQTLE